MKRLSSALRFSVWLAALGAFCLTGLFGPSIRFEAEASSAAPQMCHGRVATIVGTAGDDVLTGGPGNDVIVGLDGSDRIHGRGGADTICAGLGHSDSIHGGGGNDWLNGGEGSHDFLTGGPGRDYLRSEANRQNMAGGAGNDVLVARRIPRWVRFVSEAGNDHIRVMQPAEARFDLTRSPVGVHLDALDGTVTGRGHTTLDLVPGSSVTVVGSEHDDVLRGTDGDDKVLAELGNDVIKTAGGNDNVDGGPGHNVIHTGAGNDGVYADPREDRGRTSNRVHAGAGDDLLRFDRNDHVHGGTGKDLLWGDSCPVRLRWLTAGRVATACRPRCAGRGRARSGTTPSSICSMDGSTPTGW